MHDIEQMKTYWESCPTLRSELFRNDAPRTGYATLIVAKSEIRNTIRKNKDYQRQSALFHRHFDDWENEINPAMEALAEGNKPKLLVKQLGDSILNHFNKEALLVDRYDIYDALMNYWNETMQDDCYLISEDGWKATLYVPQPADKKTKGGEIKKAKRKEAKTIWDFACDLLPVDLVAKKYCGEFYNALLAAEEKLPEYESQKAEMEEEYKEEYLDKENFDGKTLTDSSIKKRKKWLEENGGEKEELDIINRYIDIRQQIAATKEVIKFCNAKLIEAVENQYNKLTPSEVKEMVIHNKWYGTLSKRLDEQMQQIGQQLTSSVIALVERYENTLPEIDRDIKKLENKVTAHLKAMGFNWA